MKYEIKSELLLILRQQLPNCSKQSLSSVIDLLLIAANIRESTSESIQNLKGEVLKYKIQKHFGLNTEEEPDYSSWWNV